MLLSKAREELRLDTFERSVKLARHNRAKGLSSWKERDKLSTAWLLSTPGPHYSLSSPVFAEALATLLALPSRACMDRLGEKVGHSRVDRFGERIILEQLPGGHWTRRHDAMEQEVASLCAWAGLPAECEPFGLFGSLLPQQALTRLQQHERSQVLRPDLRLEVPPTTVKVTPGRRPPAPAPGQAAAAPPAPVSQLFSGSYIAKIKFIGKGVKEYYKPGSRAQRGMEAMAKAIPREYRGKAMKMDVADGGRKALSEEARGPASPLALNSEFKFNG